MRTAVKTTGCIWVALGCPWTGPAGGCFSNNASEGNILLFNIFMADQPPSYWYILSVHIKIFLPLLGLLFHLVALKLSNSTGFCIFSTLFGIVGRKLIFQFFQKTFLSPRRTNYNFARFFLAFMFHEIVVGITSFQTLFCFPKQKKKKQVRI